MTATNAPRPSVTPTGGGAPGASTRNLDTGAVLIGIEQRVEDLLDITVGGLAPYLEDLRAVHDALGAVLEAHRTGGPVTGRALLALADAVGVTTSGPALEVGSPGWVVDALGDPSVKGDNTPGDHR